MPKAFLSQVQGLLTFEQKLIWRAPGFTMENENRKTLKPEKSPELSYTRLQTIPALHWQLAYL